MITLIAKRLGNIDGIGPLGNEAIKNIDTALDYFNRTLSNIIGLLTVIAGLFFIFLFLSGAISWLTSGGEKAAVENAQKRITTGIIGLIIVVSSIFIIDLIGTLLGLDILSPGNFVRTVWQP